MATTSPDNIYSPDASAGYNLVVHLAAMADSIQAALMSLREEFLNQDSGDPEALLSVMEHDTLSLEESIPDIGGEDTTPADVPDTGMLPEEPATEDLPPVFEEPATD